MIRKRKSLLLYLLLVIGLTNSPSLVTGEGKGGASFVHYSGSVLSDPTRHDGGLSPAIGVHNIQIMRANREHPSVKNGGGWTYNHQPMMAYWKGKFYVHYLCDEKDEQVPPSHTMLQTSVDGYTWSDPQLLFPEYKVPEWFKKDNEASSQPSPEGRENKQTQNGASNSLPKQGGTGRVSVMHQRMGFHISSENRLYALGYYGVCFNKKDHNNDGNGIGRVIREVKEDGTLGPIYFIYYNHGFNEKNTDFPNYKKGDKHLRKVCQEILSNPRVLMEWVEESDRGDKLIPLSKDYKAYNDYTLPDGRIVALWKHALTSISSDGGRTWAEPIERAKGFVNSNAKIWGQRLSDGMYATVYNPSEWRWPLAISLSGDGLNYTTLNLVCGEVPPMRYGGNYKSYGPQYVRGIQEWNGCPKDSDLWVTYSMNKEDIWVSHIPVPVRLEALRHADDDFSKYHAISELRDWNIYSPLEAQARLDGKWLVLSDSDKFDYCKVERIIPFTKELNFECTLSTLNSQLSAASQLSTLRSSSAGLQGKNSQLELEFLDSKGIACSRIELSPDGEMCCKSGARFGKVATLKAGEEYRLRCEVSTSSRMITIYVNGKKCSQRMLMAPVDGITRIMFRTGEQRKFPDIDTPADWETSPDPSQGGETRLDSLDKWKLFGAGDSAPLVEYRIADLKTTQLSTDSKLYTLNSTLTQLGKSYVSKFNSMEDENIVQAIPNDSAWQWMQENVPFFECSDKTIEEIYWYRWWTLRKHIENTPVGYAMTEFLVERSYADKYKLISSAVGHHIMESRWLRNSEYLDQIINTWYRGNDGGKPMKRLLQYSSWIPYALWQRYKVDGRKNWICSMLPDLKWEIAQWDSLRSLPNGLYWQDDVHDAMEETISGGRKKHYMRPSFNSYMYGNIKAVSDIASLAGDTEDAKHYSEKAERLCNLIKDSIWNVKQQFFETHRGDSSANVREAIGYMPWYVNMPLDKAKYGIAWEQLSDTKGFCAPYGLTTAEQRHPQFRTHGVGKCEWDGAIWPFATSQTLTGLANYINSYKDQTDSLKSIFYKELKKYAESQYKRGKPYIGEYLDEKTGYWLKGDQERSRYYNHSTFCDLVITGLCGLRPQEDGSIVVNPLIDEGITYFRIEGIPYHGKLLTILYDKDGTRYHQGKGIIVVDQKLSKN